MDDNFLKDDLIITKTHDELDKYYIKLKDQFKVISNDCFFPQYFLNEINSGKNSIYQKNFRETKNFDDSWIQTLESYFPSIDRIIRDPKKTIKFEQEVVNIEKAKKINSESVRHLASHTHLIKEVTNGNVIPKKILATYSEESIIIYENRFIMTLIKRLVKFVDLRYDYIKENYESYQLDRLNYTSNFKIKNTDVNLSFDLSVRRDLDNAKINQKNLDLLKRVEHLSNLIHTYDNSQFMKKMKEENATLVKSPILKTNIILKNVDFKNCHTLWLFLDRYHIFGFSNDVRTKNLPVDLDYENDIKNVAMQLYMTMLYNQDNRKTIYQEIPFTLKKHAKIKEVQELPSELISDSKKIDETDQINEYYFNETKKLYQKKYKEYGKTFTKEQSLRKLLRDMQSVTNTLYEQIFTVALEEDDIFQKLVKKKSDSSEKLKEAKEKSRIAKIIREVKKVDFNNAVRLEKKYIKQIENINKNIIKQKLEDKLTKQNLENQKKLDKEIKIKEKEKKDAIAKRKLLRELEKQKIKKEMQKERELAKLAVLKEREKALAKERKEKERLKEKLKLQKQKEKEKEKLRLKKERQKEKEHQKLLQKKAKEKNKKLTSNKKSEINNNTNKLIDNNSNEATK